ncbi:unnamed protein product [Ambrosiozyma monospora]|uniref:Unnamed protein product n=1 Tax=Ambrosiozyma monospora TaxID=43982 RepID=A0A9W7DH02_AMBMO|nr:unnamed protein product [Ambrosiozyma monospora]
MAHSRVYEHLKDNPSLTIEIPEANKSTEAHSAISQSFIVYTVKLSELLTVKRRYSEFESLRNILIKYYLNKIIPPIPEKQTLGSNISTTTSNLGLSKDSSGVSNKGNSAANGGRTLKSGSVSSQGSSSFTSGSGQGQANNTLNLIEYRKRMLAVFLNRCLHSIEGIIENEFFISFFNPEVNFNDYLLQEHANIAKLNKYRIAVYDPLNNLDNQLYLTLPIPTSSNLAMFPEMVNEEQFQILELVLKKFAKYEVILDNISKCNKRIIKHYNEVNANMCDMGSCFNKLSLLQDSDFIEEMGKNFERKLIYSNALVELINLRFLDKLIELKNFTKTVKELIEFNRKKQD